MDRKEFKKMDGWARSKMRNPAANHANVNASMMLGYTYIPKKFSQDRPIARTYGGYCCRGRAAATLNMVCSNTRFMRSRHYFWDTEDFDEVCAKLMLAKRFREGARRSGQRLP